MSDILQFLMLLTTGVYGVLLIISWVSFRRMKFTPQYASRSIHVAVVVAARNEERNIDGLLKALEAQDCVFKYDVIIVDDSSEDRTVEIARSHWAKKFNLSVLANGGIGKKDAITTGVHSSLADVILVTDADCIPDVKWVSKMTEQFYDMGCVFVAGMVRPRDGDGFLNATLETETIFLQVVSAGMFAQKNPILCNGASMGFTRKFFMDVQGFTNDRFVSGDDVLLLQKARWTVPTGIRWMTDKNAMVETPLAPTLNDAIEQRSRWISKTKAYSGPMLNVLGPVFLTVQLLLPLGVLWFTMISSFHNPFWVPLFIKILVELLLLSLAATFFRATNVILMLPVSAVVYCIISIGAVFRLFSGDVRWKGRTWKNGQV